MRQYDELDETFDWLRNFLRPGDGWDVIGIGNVDGTNGQLVEAIVQRTIQGKLAFPIYGLGADTRTALEDALGHAEFHGPAYGMYTRLDREEIRQLARITGTWLATMGDPVDTPFGDIRAAMHPTCSPPRRHGPTPPVMSRTSPGRGIRWQR